MIDLSLSLSPRKCKHVGCSQPAAMFGVCQGHEKRDILRHFLWAVNKNSANESVPACFNSRGEWMQYVVASNLSTVGGQSSKTIDYCRDCTPKYKRECMDKGTCGHTETVFIRSDNHNGGLIGVSIPTLGKSDAWEKAIMGMSGEVVTLPPASVIDQQLRAINTPKKRGPKPKVKDV